MRVSVLALVVGITVAGATTPFAFDGGEISLSGEWRDGRRIVLIEHTRNEVRGSWKEAYTHNRMTCSGMWFEGTISGNKVSGVRHTCSPNSRPYALDLTVVDANTLDIYALHNGTGTTTRLRRIK